MKRPDWLPGFDLRLWPFRRRPRLDVLTDVLRDYESCAEGEPNYPDVGRFQERPAVELVA